ncbi:two-component system, chemotaxis family, response regulator CheY [Gracilibacillus ureilyticus]|uniref:Two-component system, chemotaxis family, response regulator CheY n=1 Tax=Gracilibacillus ureilyticus TaxID=531814 RepID=A0A1H9S4T5_9BACI|nr:response regulator [Gracilibacillus ureilyticus]SER79159.1 two-component system, chemotaxis family, response regulator CheY [Gracilibacillus ureilyticus]
MAQVLIVDDAAFMRMQLKNIFTKLGHEVVGEAENGVQATELYEQLKPDIVSMDITMPEMNGVEATKEIKSKDGNATIIMCSAMGQQQMVLDAIKAGAKDFIVKPFTEERVKETLDKLL